MTTRRVLFICTHNSARSQMAEGFLRAYGGEAFEVHSAGIEATFVRPEAIRAMNELGIDISGQTSKSLEPYRGQPWDWVITVCDRAREACPVFHGAEAAAHWGFDDPTEATGTEEERLEVYRAVAGEIARRVRTFISVAARQDLEDPAATTL